MSAPFKRINALISMCAVAVAGMSMAEASAYKQKMFATYKSRGKGKGNGRDRNVFPQNSRYMPHQGKKECARRVKQMV